MSGTPSGPPTVALRHSSPAFGGGLEQLPRSVNGAAERFVPTFETHGKAKFAALPAPPGSGDSIVLIRSPVAPLMM